MKTSRKMTTVFQSALLLGSLGAASGMAQASGFALIEQSASGQGLSYAGAAANAEDASIMWFNPAGLTQIENDQLIVAGHVISPKAEFNNPTTGASEDGATVGFVPNVYWKTKIADLDFGFGVNVPFGQKIEYDEDWEGAGVATTTDLTTINLNPAIAMKINEQLSVGFGLNAQYVDVVLEQKVPLNGDVSITGDSWAFGYNFGFMFQPSANLNVGLAYRSKMQHDVSGKADYENINNTVNLGGYTLNQVLYDMNANADVTLPASASLAIDYKISDKTNLLASTTWTAWSQYDQLVIEFENGTATESNQDFGDSMRYALGMMHQYNDQFKVRAGVAIDYTPVPSAENRSPRTPDSDRKWVSIGGGYKLSKEMNLDVAYSHLFASKSDINYQGLTGYYDSAVDIFSAQFVWNY